MDDNIQGSPMTQETPLFWCVNNPTKRGRESHGYLRMFINPLENDQHDSGNPWKWLEPASTGVLRTNITNDP